MQKPQIESSCPWFIICKGIEDVKNIFMQRNQHIHLLLLGLVYQKIEASIFIHQNFPIAIWILDLDLGIISNL
jgi:hypothetical protein